MEPSPWGAGGTGKGRYVNRVDLDGFAVIQDYTQEVGGKIVFRGHGVFGVDVPANQVHWYWVDSTGHWPPGPSTGRWDGGSLVMTSSSPQGDGRYTFRLEGKDALEFRLENSSDGGKSFKVFMTGRYKKIA